MKNRNTTAPKCDQLDFALPTSRALIRQGLRKRSERARWWFQRMRDLVDSATPPASFS